MEPMWWIGPIFPHSLLDIRRYQWSRGRKQCSDEFWVRPGVWWWLLIWGRWWLRQCITKCHPIILSLTYTPLNCVSRKWSKSKSNFCYTVIVCITFILHLVNSHRLVYIIYDLDLHSHHVTFMSKCLVGMRNRLSTLENHKFDTLFVNFGYILPDLWEKVE